MILSGELEGAVLIFFELVIFLVHFGFEAFLLWNRVFFFINQSVIISLQNFIRFFFLVPKIGQEWVLVDQVASPLN